MCDLRENPRGGMEPWNFAIIHGMEKAAIKRSSTGMALACLVFAATAAEAALSVRDFGADARRAKFSEFEDDTERGGALNERDSRKRKYGCRG